jgi:dTDP-glucose 4,6-dehydratase
MFSYKDRYILVTGGSGFIGSNFIRYIISVFGAKIVNLDKLSYAGCEENLIDIQQRYEDYVFIKGDIRDLYLLSSIFIKYKPLAVINFAAESHVDRSIKSPESFMETNIFGTFALLKASMTYYESLDKRDGELFRFLQISTDEVYGSLESTEPPFTEDSPYRPNSPYSASKAASDHLVRAWNHTYNLPVLTLNCSNNYGPYQFPEKLIPLAIMNASNMKLIPIYGDGKNIRDWLFVEDHCRAIYSILERGKVGGTYNVGGGNQKTNLETISLICQVLDKYIPIKDEIYHPLTQDPLVSYKQLIDFVTDRPGHDRRYAIDTSKISNELSWKPIESFDTGIEKTVLWYLENRERLKKYI